MDPVRIRAVSSRLPTPTREEQTKQHLTSDLIMPRAKQPTAHHGFDSDLSSPPNSPRLAPVKARMKNEKANASKALPLQPSVIANTPKKRPHEDDQAKDAPKPKKTRKNDDKPAEPVSLLAYKPSLCSLYLLTCFT